MSDPKSDPTLDAIKAIFSDLTEEERAAWQRATSAFPPSEEDAVIVHEQIIAKIQEKVAQETEN